MTTRVEGNRSSPQRGFHLDAAHASKSLDALLAAAPRDPESGLSSVDIAKIYGWFLREFGIAATPTSLARMPRTEARLASTLLWKAIEKLANGKLDVMDLAGKLENRSRPDVESASRSLEKIFFGAAVERGTKRRLVPPAAIERWLQVELGVSFANLDALDRKGSEVALSLLLSVVDNVAKSRQAPLLRAIETLRAGAAPDRPGAPAR